MKRLSLFLLLLLLAGAVLAGLRFYMYSVSPHYPSRRATARVIIPEGASVRKTAAILEQTGVIGHPELFVLLARLKKAEHRIKAGQYRMPLPLSPLEVLERLLRGEVALVTVTVPEGSNIFDIARIIDQAGLKPEQEVLKKATDAALARRLGFGDNDTLEGYLFPDTYKFSPHMKVREILTHMVKRFRTVFSRELQSAQPPGGLSPRELVTLASLVEKETGDPSERAVIAGVFYNRLRLGMRLECDPTVVYGVLLDDPAFTGRLRRKHLRKANGYNTYQMHGLPAGPICNPGLASLRAVLNPAPVDYLFFVSRNDGTHQFSRTLREHNRAVNKYQR